MKSLEEIVHTNKIHADKSHYLVLVNQDGKYLPRFYYGAFVQPEEIMNQKLFMHANHHEPIMGIYYIDMETEINRFEQLRKS